ncbi:MAG: UDP-N-acetyl-D-mannosamine dehydrogenase [Alphaproteobacteria bacterium]|nr:UDP-N-acetyl-D-mannosamine dehydrogenase [Alphaproteobacteria bacterium]
MSRVCVVGLGYVGLPSAALLAARGHEVLGCDINPEVVAAVQAGWAHVVEPDLDMLLEAAVATGRLRAATAPAPADYLVLAVPTPITPDHQPDLSMLEAAADSIAPILRAACCVIIESTIPVGTTEAIAARLAALRPDLRFPIRGGPIGDVMIAHCPERVLPGRTVQELVSNARVIGGITQGCAEVAAALYASFAIGPRHLTDCRTAEFVKLAENAYRDVNIAFANELANLGARTGVDPWPAIRLANHHPRVSILRPGPGVGGHCIAVDPWFLAAAAPDAAPLIRAARGVNEGRPATIAAEIAQRAEGRPVALLGLSYKPDIDDLRESPALAVARILAGQGVALLVVEPHLRALPAGLAGAALVDAGAALNRAHCIGLLVAHSAFAPLRAALAGRCVVDAAGLLAA